MTVSWKLPFPVVKLIFIAFATRCTAAITAGHAGLVAAAVVTVTVGAGAEGEACGMGAPARGEQETREVSDRLRSIFHDYLVATIAYYHAVHQMHELGRARGDDFDTWVRREYQALQEEYQYLAISAGDEVRRLARAYDMVLYGLRDAAVAYDEDAWANYRAETHRSRERVRVAMRAELGIHDNSASRY